MSNATIGPIINAPASSAKYIITAAAIADSKAKDSSAERVVLIFIVGALLARVYDHFSSPVGILAMSESVMPRLK